MSTITDLSTPLPTNNTKSVLFFWTSWHEDSAPNGSTSNLFETLASTAAAASNQEEDNNTISFYRVEAEQNTKLSTLYNVTVVPTFVFLEKDGSILEKIEGMDDSENISKVTNALQSLIQSQTNSSNNSGGNEASTTTTTETTKTKDPKEELNQKLKSLINSSTIMLFMKGTPNEPKCGFSRQAIEILTAAKLRFKTFDILQDNDVRQGLKEYSDWPTYPQLYVNGELMGGLDIMKEMNEESDDDGGFVSALGLDPSAVGGDFIIQEEEVETTKNAKTDTLEERLKGLISQSKIMLFMKGLPSQPRCGFSRQICELLQKENVKFDAFDILTDEDVRQGLKKLSDWPTYPQLYVDGELVGGLDIVRELIESGELKDMIEG